MKHDSRHTKPPSPPDRELKDEREPRRERDRRIGAAQMAAPSTRTWRRAGRFGSSS